MLQPEGFKGDEDGFSSISAPGFVCCRVPVQ